MGARAMSDVAVDRPQSLRLLIILLIGMPCMSLCMYVMLNEGLIKSESFIVGMFIGQLAFLGVLAGGMGRSWIYSLLLTSLLAMSVPLAMMAFEYWRRGGDFVNPILLILGCTAPLIYCCSVPFLMTRGISGYRLSQPLTAVRRPVNMEDFFLTTGICAAMLVTVPAAFKTTDEAGEGIVMTMAMVGLIACGVSLLVVLPATIAYFVIKRKLIRLLVLASLCIGVPMLSIWLLSLSGAVRLTGTTFVEEFASPLVTAAGCFAICLVVLRAAGFQWRRDPRQAAVAAIDPLADDEDAPAKPAPERRLNRVAALCVISASAGFVLFCQRLETLRKTTNERLTAIELEWSKIDSELGKQVGYISRYNYTVRGFSAPPRAKLEDIEFLLQSSYMLSRIDLSGSGVTDAMLGQIGGLADLYEINLSRTNVGDVGLRYLNSAKRVRKINLSHTKVTTEGLREFLRGRKVDSLDLSGLGLTDKDIAQLPLSSISSLTLSHNPLTRAVLPHVHDMAQLDLSHTQVDGADVAQLNFSYIDLDYTPITDEQLQVLLEKSPNLHGLSIRGTPITDASLPQLEKVAYLAIGDSPITPTGLAQSSLATRAENSSNGANFTTGMTGITSSLLLNDPRFDGSIFATRKWIVDHLDLRRSSISDDNITSLANVTGMSILNLHGCNVSDASLPFLSSLSVTVIDLSDTKVTGEAAFQYLNNITVYISPSQCSEAVLQSIRSSNGWHLFEFHDGLMD